MLAQRPNRPGVIFHWLNTWVNLTQIRSQACLTSRRHLMNSGIMSLLSELAFRSPPSEKGWQGGPPATKLKDRAGRSGVPSLGGKGINLGHMA